MVNNALRFVRLLPRNYFEALSENPAWNLIWSSLSDVKTLPVAARKKLTLEFLGVTQEGWYSNSLSPQDQYLNGICMWVEINLGPPTCFFFSFFQLSCEATETLESIPVRAMLISGIAYLPTALTEGVGCPESVGGEGSTIYTVLCSLKPVNNQIRTHCHHYCFAYLL